MASPEAVEQVRTTSRASSVVVNEPIKFPDSTCQGSYDVAIQSSSSHPEGVCYDAHMKRTTILLPDDLAYLLERERRRRGVSAAAIVREAVAAHFNISSEPRRLSFVGLGDSGVPDLGTNLEYYLDQAWGSEEFFEETMGRARTPEEKAAPRHYAIWKPENAEIVSEGDAQIRERELDESGVGN